MKLSILTATYNRAELLKRLYTSIKENIIEQLDIEWLIMDDGSEDDTESVVESFEKNNNFEIKYYKQKNQGKMSAINNLMKYVTGDLVMDCDSDDYFVNNAFKEIFDKKDLLFNNNIYALIFLKSEGNGRISGNKFEKENIKTTMFDMYFKDKIVGEKILVFRSDIRKNYMHEMEANEKFITEARMYHKMDKENEVICFNIPIVEGVYLEDGYTKNFIKTFIEAPRGYYKYFEEILQRNMKGVTLEKRLYAIKHYILFSYILGKKMNIKEINDIMNKILVVLMYIPGVLVIKLKGTFKRIK